MQTFKAQLKFFCGKITLKFLNINVRNFFLVYLAHSGEAVRQLPPVL